MMTLGENTFMSELGNDDAEQCEQSHETDSDDPDDHDNNNLP